MVIPTNAGDRGSIVLKAGQKVMVLKSPKGIYMQLESGKIIAIRTSPNNKPLNGPALPGQPFIPQQSHQQQQPNHQPHQQQPHQQRQPHQQQQSHPHQQPPTQPSMMNYNRISHDNSFNSGHKHGLYYILLITYYY